MSLIFHSCADLYNCTLYIYIDFFIHLFIDSLKYLAFEDWVHKTRLTPPPLVVPRKKSDRSYIYVLWVSSLASFYDCFLDFRTVLTVWYLLFFILLEHIIPPSFFYFPMWYKGMNTKWNYRCVNVQSVVVWSNKNTRKQ